MVPDDEVGAAFAGKYRIERILGSGGMGTVLGVLVGATILKLLPEKLREVNDYRLLVFGLLLVVMMRFRPEGLVASKRRQLEFHEEDEELAVAVESELIGEAK